MFRICSYLITLVVHHIMANGSSKLTVAWIMLIYCILRGRIKGFNSAIYAIKCQQVVIELWLGSYSTVVG